MEHFCVFDKKLRHVCLRGSNYASLAVSFIKSNSFINKITWTYRSRHSQMHFKIKWVLLKISKISLEKYMCWSLFLRKLQAPRPANLLKRNPNTGIFLWNWQDFQKHFFLQNTSGGWFLKKNNSNILFKDFSGIPLTHNKSLITCNSHSDKLNLKMHSLTKN